MQKCPKCSSEDIKDIETAHFVPEGKPVSYMGDSAPEAYECKKCGFRWDNKK